MKKLISILLGALLCTVALPAHAQDSSACEATGSLTLADEDAAADSSAAATDGGMVWAKRSRVTDRTPAVSVSASTQAESFVQDRIQQDGLHVVHFWAPWCSNSTSELDGGWAKLVANNPNVTFTFVTVWNDNEDGASVLDSYNLPDRVAEVTQPDLGASDNESTRRRSFLGIPVTWIPSTWIFHRNGELAFALNYGEMEMTTIQSLLEATRTDW